MEDSVIHGRAGRLSDLVGYQDGAIVSRTLIKGANGSVTVFAFDQGQELSEHTVPFDAFVFVCDGEAEIRISEVINQVRTGEAIVMPASQPHSIKAVRRFKMMLSMVRSP
jgi:quercetin dioxygenase-like cupin family protein